MASYTITPVGAFAQDSWITSTETDPQGTENSLFFGNQSTSAKRAILEFPVRGIRPGATVTAATLTLKALTYPGTAFTATCERLARYDWDQVGATWTAFDSGALWTTAGGDVAITTPAAVTFNVPTSGSITVNVATFVQDAMDNRAGRLVLRLRGPESSAHQLEIASGQYTDETLAPSLSITTTETDLGYAYTAIKRIASSWITSGSLGAVGNSASGFYIGIGVGVNPSSDYLSRRRLSHEIYRKPLLGRSIDPASNLAYLWGYFGSGEGAGTITEIGLFTNNSITVIDSCESAANWAGTGWSIAANSTRQQGSLAILASETGGVDNPIVVSSLNVDLRSYNLDDYVYFWARKGDAGTLDSLSLTLTDNIGTWAWADISSQLVSNDTWYPIALRFRDATATPSVSGPSVVTSMTFNISTTGDKDVRFDYIRAIKGEEDILLWAPPTGGSLVKVVTDQKKVYFTLTSKRGTN